MICFLYKVGYGGRGEVYACFVCSWVILYVCCMLFVGLGLVRIWVVVIFI